MKQGIMLIVIVIIGYVGYSKYTGKGYNELINGPNTSIVDVEETVDNVTVNSKETVISKEKIKDKQRATVNGSTSAESNGADSLDNGSIKFGNVGGNIGQLDMSKHNSHDESNSNSSADTSNKSTSNDNSVSNETTEETVNTRKFATVDEVKQGSEILKSSIGSKVKDLKSSVNTKVKDLKDGVDDKVETVTKTVTKTTERVTKINDLVYETTDDLNKKTRDIDKHVEQANRKSQSALESGYYMNKRISTMQDDFNETIQKEIKNRKQDTNDTFDFIGGLKKLFNIETKTRADDDTGLMSNIVDTNKQVDDNTYDLLTHKEQINSNSADILIDKIQLDGKTEANSLKVDLLEADTDSKLNIKSDKSELSVLVSQMVEERRKTDTALLTVIDRVSTMEGDLENINKTLETLTTTVAENYNTLNSKVDMLSENTDIAFEVVNERLDRGFNRFLGMVIYAPFCDETKGLFELNGGLYGDEKLSSYLDEHTIESVETNGVSIKLPDWRGTTFMYGGAKGVPETIGHVDTDRTARNDIHVLYGLGNGLGHGDVSVPATGKDHWFVQIGDRVPEYTYRTFDDPPYVTQYLPMYGFDDYTKPYSVSMKMCIVGSTPAE